MVEQVEAYFETEVNLKKYKLREAVSSYCEKVVKIF